MMRHRLWMKLAILSCWVGFAAICVAAGRAGAAPVVFWASDPIRPGETVLVSGEGFGERPSVEVWRLGDGPAETSSAKPPIRPAQTEQAKVVQPGDKSLKFLVPGSLKPGLYAYRLSAGGASTQGLLNRPAVWWALGDGGTFATPGGSVRFFGKNLARPGQERGKVTLLLQGPRSVRLTAQADCYAGQCALPRDLPTGEYQLLVHSGCGGAAGWSEAITLRLERPKPWPAKVFNVRDFEADGTGSTDHQQRGGRQRHPDRHLDSQQRWWQSHHWLQPALQVGRGRMELSRLYHGGISRHHLRTDQRHPLHRAGRGHQCHWHIQSGHGIHRDAEDGARHGHHRNLSLIHI